MNIKGLTSNGSNLTRPNEYLYNGKMMQDEMGLGWLDYGARFYDAVLGRFHVQDAFSEKYLGLTQYQYGANNPISYIDINGDSTYRFDNNGTYLGMFDLDQHGTRGAIGRNKTYKDKNGDKQSMFITEMNFNFNDPANDKNQLSLMEVGKQGLQIVTEENINDIMNNSNIEAKGFLRRYFFAATESGSSRDQGKGNEMDFGIKYLGGKSGGGNNDNYGGFFIFGDQQHRAYNALDGGNWLWGQGMKRLGFDYSTSQFSSQANEGFKDTKGDQKAIVAGYHYIVKTNNAVSFILKNVKY
jgi:RHS repeat-associated protein